MGTSLIVELEAAKFLQKVIQDSKDEPAKMARKFYVILQYMKSSGKEHSMPYQVIFRAMETVINQHGLDIEALRLSHLPLSGGNQIGDSATAQFAGSSQAGGVANDSKVGFAENEVSKVDPFASNRPPVGPSSAGHDYYQGSLAHRSANSQSQERQQKDGKEATTKRKRGETSLPMEQHIGNTQQLDTRNAVVNPRKGKMNKVEPQASLSVKGGECTNFNMVPSSGQVEHFASLSGSMRPMLRVNQEGQHAIERQLDSSNISNLMLQAPNPKFPEEVEVSSAHNASQQGGSLPSHDIRGVWNQNKTGLPFGKSQIPRFPSNVPGNMMSEIPTQQSTTPSLGSGAFGKDHSGMPVASSSYLVVEPGFLSPMQFSGSLEHGGGSNMLADANNVVQISQYLKLSGREHSIPYQLISRYALVRKSDLIQVEAAKKETFEEPEMAADIAMLTTTPPAALVAPVFAIPAVPASATPAAPTPFPAISIAPIPTSPSLILTPPSQFKVGNSSATIPDPMGEAVAFFTRFDQPEVNDLDPANFWGSGPPYVDFHGFRVPEDCASHLEAVYSSRGDFMQGFHLGRSVREHFLKMLGSVMNDIEHNFLDTVSTERILQWRAAIQELVSVGFAVEFILDHLRAIARAFFMKKVQPAVDAIDTCLETLRKEVADLEGRRECLLSSIGGSSHFGDQPLISGLR